MRLPVLVGLAILGVLALKGLLVVSILLGLTVVLPLLLAFAIVVGLIGGLVVAPVLAVRFMLYCLRGFRPSPVAVPTPPRPPAPPPLGARPHHEAWSPRPSDRPTRACGSRGWLWAPLTAGILVVCVVTVANRSRSLCGPRVSRIGDNIARAGDRVRDKVTRWAITVKPAPRAVLPAVPGDDVSAPPWVHTGFGVNEEDAYRSALEKARRDLAAYLAAQSPPIRWTPTIDEMEHVAHVAKEGGTKDFGRDVGEMYEAHVRVDLTAKDRALIAERDRSEQMEDRVWLALRILAAAVVVMAAVAGYVRLDDWSKGYYTTWLRLGVAGAIAAACGLVWHFTF